MQNKLILNEALFEAMDAFSSRNNGMEGILIEDIMEEVIIRGGDEHDLINAILIYVEFVLTKIAEILN